MEIEKLEIHIRNDNFNKESFGFIEPNYLDDLHYKCEFCGKEFISPLFFEKHVLICLDREDRRLALLYGAK